MKYFVFMLLTASNSINAIHLSDIPMNLDTDTATTLAVMTNISEESFGSLQKKKEDEMQIQES